MGPSAWRGAWTALVRCGRATYTAPVLPRGRIFTKQAVGVADGSGFKADLSALKVNSKLVSRAGAPVPANGPSEVRLVEAALAARCGCKCPTWLRRYAASIRLAMRDQIQYEETMSWRRAEVAVNLGGGVGDRAPYNCPTMVCASKEDEMLFEDLFVPPLDDRKVLLEDPFVAAFDSKSQTNNLKSASLVSPVCSPARLPLEKLGGNLHGFHYICSLPDAAIMNAELWCEKQFNKLQSGPLDFDSIYGIPLANKVISQIIRYEHEGDWSSALEYYDLLARLTPKENLASHVVEFSLVPALPTSNQGIGAKSAVSPFKTVGGTLGSIKLPQRMFSTSQYLSHAQRGRSFSTRQTQAIVGIGAKSAVSPVKTVGGTLGSIKLPQRMFSTSQCLSHAQRGRSFSTRQTQRKSMMHIEMLMPKNTGVLCLDGGNHDVLLSFRKLIAQIRDYCYEYGKRVDLSVLYGRVCEVYTPPGDGSFHVFVQHCGHTDRISISARDLYLRVFRGGNHKPLELQVNDGDDDDDVVDDDDDDDDDNDDDDGRDEDYSYISSEEDHTVLPFSGSYTSLCAGAIGDTWIGVAALRHAFHVLHKYDGRGTDSLKQAIAIFVIHLAEASRLQPVFNAISRSMVNDNIYLLDDVSQPSDGATQKASSRPSWWVSNYGWYSREAMKAVDKCITENKEYIIVNRRGGNIKLPSEIFKEIRILSRDAYTLGVFADKAGDPPLALPRESPPTDTGKEADFPYVRLDNLHFGSSTNKMEK